MKLFPLPLSPARQVTLPRGIPLLKSPEIKKLSAKFPVLIQSTGSWNPLDIPGTAFVILFLNFDISNGFIYLL